MSTSLNNQVNSHSRGQSPGIDSFSLKRSKRRDHWDENKVAMTAIDKVTIKQDCGDYFQKFVNR